MQPSRSIHAAVCTAVIAVAVGSVHLAAQERPALVEVIGPRAYDVPVRQAAPAKITLSVLARQGKAAPKRLEVQDVTLGGRTEGDWKKAFAFAWNPAAQSEYATIVVTIDPVWILDTGAYTVNALAIADGDASKPGSPPVTQLISFTFTRPAPVLYAPPTLKLEGFSPWPGSDGALAPDRFIIAESSWRTALADVKAIVLEEPRTAAGASAKIELSSPPPLSAGGTAWVTLTPAGGLPLGTSTGKLSIGSRQLAQAATVPVEIVTHLYRGWLLVPIVVGIVLGYLVRVRAESRIERAKAMIAADEQLARIRRAALGVRDQTVRATIDRAAIALREQMTAAAEPAAIIAAAQQAGTIVDDALKQLEARRTSLRADVAQLRATLQATLDEHAPPVRDAIREARGMLDRLDKELDEGRTGDVSSQLRTAGEEIDSLIKPAISTWTLRLETAMQRLAPWPGRSVEEARSRIQQEVTALALQADRKQLLSGAAGLAIDVRRNLLSIGTQDAVVLARHVRTGIGPDAAQAGPLDAAIDAASRFVGEMPEADQIDRFVDVMSALRGALSDVLKTAAAKTTTDIAGMLTEGRFDDALKAVIAARPKPERALRPGDAPVMGMKSASAPAPLPEQSVPAQATARQCTIAFTPAAAIADTPIEFSLIASPEFPPTAVITWTIDGQVVPGAAGVRTVIFTPIVNGMLKVRADVADDTRPDVAPCFATISINVLPANRFEIADERREQQAAERLRTIIAGGLIAGAGYLIFEAAFIGTFKDFFVPLLWGFTVDVGVAKVQQLAAPIAAKALP